jgi:hypothetical protein
VVVAGSGSGGRMEETGDSAEPVIGSSGVSSSLRIRLEVVEVNVRNINAIDIIALRDIVVVRVSKCAMLVSVR